MTTTKPCPALQSRIAAFAGRVNKLATKVPPRRSRFATDAELELPDLYTPLDAPHTQADEHDGSSAYLLGLGLPGEFPFTRGVQPNMYRGRLWTMRQYAGFGSAADSNRRYHYLLQRGQTGLSVAFDLPTQMGRDPDHELSHGEVGRVGVSIASLADMRMLLAGLPLDQDHDLDDDQLRRRRRCWRCMSRSRTSKGCPRKLLGGTVQNDILKEYIARGTYIYPPRPSLRLITDLFSFCHAELPQWNTISISGYHIREAGSDAVQEVAFTLADGIAYVEAALAVGLKVDEFAPRLSFFFNGHNNLIEEVAKFRAARRLWARIMRERFSAKDDKSLMLRFHCADGGIDADGAAAAVQRGAQHGAGAGGDLGRLSVAARELV
jgi:methylmalonyl-CoA mutase N-terminal domain/subunit